MTTQHCSFPQHNITGGSHYTALSALNLPPAFQRDIHEWVALRCAPPGRPLPDLRPRTQHRQIQHQAHTSNFLLRFISTSHWQCLVRARERSEGSSAPAARNLAIIQNIFFDSSLLLEKRNYSLYEITHLVCRENKETYILSLFQNKIQWKPNERTV